MAGRAERFDGTEGGSPKNTTIKNSVSVNQNINTLCKSFNHTFKKGSENQTQIKNSNNKFR